jgi:TolB protein
MRPRTTDLVGIVVIGATMFSTDVRAQTDTSPIRVMVEYRDSTADIYVVNADGTLGKNLTNTPEGRGSWIPSFSRDCSRIVFASNRDDGGGAAIYVMDADGSNIRQLTRRGGRDWDYMPIFSPDANRILYIATVSRKRTIWVMDADGSNQRRFTDTPGENWYSIENPWSPDGTKFVLHSTWETGATVSYQPEYKLGGTDLFVADPDGSDVRRLTQVKDTTEANAEAVWSPDGTKIMFASTRDGGKWRQWIMDADGSNQRQLTQAEASDITRSFEWSPDGSKILFESNRDGNWEVWVMEDDGSNQRQLTHTSRE